MLTRQTETIPLAYGLRQGTDPRALRAGDFSICRNVQFDESGGLQTRKPFANMSLSIVGGGTVADPRTLAVYGDELLLYTKDELYTWSERAEAWVLRANHLAISVEEKSAFAVTGDQVFADQAEVDGVAVHVWMERLAGGSTSLHIAALDVVTGAVLHPPSLITTVTAPAIRAVAMASQVLVIYNSAANAAEGFAVTPATASASISAGISSPTVFGLGTTTGRMDAVFDATSGNVFAVFDRVGAYQVARIPANLSETSQSYARSVGGPVAIAVEVTGAGFTVAREDAGSVIRADRINKTTMGDITVDVSLGTPTSSTVNQITCEYRATGVGVLEDCFVFWTSGSSTSGAAGTFTTEMNTFEQIGGTGTARILVRRLAIASRAFRHDGQIYVWLAFAGQSEASGMSVQTGLRAQLQNVYLLFAENTVAHAAEPLAKAVSDRAGGLYSNTGRLPGVQSVATGVYQWSGIERRIIPLNDRQTNYMARTPKTIRFSFDSLGGRRSVRLGRTLYVAGGQVHQYDGISFVEVGFHVAPYSWTAVSLAGNLAAGAYNHVSTDSWVNAVQERERSTTVASSSTTVAANQLIEFSGSASPFLYATRKKNSRSPVAREYWRSAVDASPEAPLHLVTSFDPAATTNPNRYIANDPTDDFVPTFQDDLEDDDLRLREQYGESGLVLQNLPPVGASIIVATQDRLILAGLADDPHGFAYSKLRGEGEIAAFNGLLRGSLPPEGGVVTAVAFLAETLVLFKEHAIYMVPGDGFDNLGQGANYGPGRIISSGVGALSHESVVLTPRGLLFKSSKGWYLLTGWQEPTYVGERVKDFDSEEIRGIVVVEDQHQVRVVTSERILVWDYEAYKEQGGAWSEWTSTVIDDCLSTVIWRGQHVVLTDSSVLRQAEFGDGDVSETVEVDVELGWIVTAEWQAIWELNILAEWRGAARMRVRLKRNYKESVVFQDKTYTPTADQAALGEPVIFRHRPSILQHEALKVRLTARHEIFDAAPAGEAFSLTALRFEFGVDQARLRGMASSNSQ